MTSRRLREPAGWTPVWDSAVKGWTINFIKENKWRCDAINSFEDLLQDAYLTFRRVAAAYPRVTEPRHFMALFMRAMKNEMIDRARYKQRKDEVTVTTEADVAELFAGRIGEKSNEGYLRALIAELPEEVLAALMVYTDEGKLEKLRNTKQSKLAKLAGVPKVRENLNMQLRRAAGIKSNVDIIGQLRSLLGETDGK